MAAVQRRCMLSQRRLAAVLVAIACGHTVRASVAVPSSQLQAQLRIVAFAPFADSDALTGTVNPVLISGKQALTVTFSHAVIRLGADFDAGPLPASLNPFRFSPAVPGRVRWVTTSIARFDADSEWPAELRVNVTINPSLRALGSNLNLGNAPTFALRTPPLQMSVVSVASSQALAVTNGSWDPALAPLVPGALEVPPDGRVRLHFSSAVDLELLTASLRIIPVRLNADDPASLESGVSLSPCRRAAARCVHLEALEPLEPETVYEIVLPAGSRFHPAAGAAHSRLSVKISGLVPFTFPFLQVDPKDSHQDLRPRYRRYSLLLRHGLSPDTSLEQLQAAIAIEPPQPFTLTRPTAATIVISASFDPNSKYTLRVNPHPDVRDGFGLPLQAAYSTFVTDAYSTGFELPSAESYYNAPPARFHVGAGLDAPAEWHAAAFGAGMKCFSGTKCNPDEAVRALLNTVSADDVRAAIASLSNRISPPIGADPSAAFGSLSSAPPVKGFEIRSAGFGDSLQSDSQLVMLTKQNSHTSYVSSLISAGRLEVVVLGVPDGSVLLWALDSATNTAAAGAHVDLYDVSNPYLASASDILLEQQGVTDSRGLLLLSTSSTRRGGARVAVIRAANSSEMLVVPGVQLLWPAVQPHPLATLISDRAVYTEGDQVHLKGYLRLPSGDALALLPSSASISVRVLWKGDEAEVTPVVADEEYGAFNLTLTVPEGATFGRIPIRLYVSAEQASMVATADIVIADPRPPTVVLSVSAGESVGADGETLGTASSVLPPNGTVGLKVRTATLSGVPVGGASVTLRWQLTPASRLAPCVRCGYDRREVDLPAIIGFARPVADAAPNGVAEGFSGEQLLTTGASGELAIQWRPPADAAVEVLGDSLRIEVEWVGPAREVVSKSLVVPVALSEYTLSVSAPPHSVLPGHTFELAADITTHAALGGTRAVGVPLEFLLYRLPDDVEAGDHGDPWFTNEEPDALLDPAAQCVVLSADSGPAHSATCEMQLPAAGQFVGAVCALDEADGSTRRFCSGMRLGKGEAAWNEQPLSEYLQLAVTPELRRTSYDVGETGQIGLYNPLQSPVVALLAWGNTLGRKVLTTPPLAPGKNTIEFDVGDECLGGCALSLHIAAAADADRELQVPVSPLLELRAPLLASHSFTLDAQPSRRALRVSVTPDSAVARPGDDTGFTIALFDDDGNPVSGEVCVFAVDKAMLALRPHPLVNLAERLSPPLRGTPYAHTSSYEQLVSSAGLGHSAARLQQLLDLDPWLRVQWPLRPTSVDDRTSGVAWVEAPIEQVLSHARTAITAMPSRSRPNDVTGEVPEEEFDGDGGWRFQDGLGGDISEQSARAEFATTPVFAPSLRIGASGSVHVPWSLPGNTGAFELRVYASTGADAHFGAATADQLVRKTVTLSALMPRIARANDEFFGGVTVTGSPELPPDTQLTVTLEVQPQENASAAPPLELWYESSSTVSLSPGQTIEVTFPLRASVLGEASLVARVWADSADGGRALGDALQMKLTVLGMQPEVSVATSRALTATAETAMWTEGVVLPEAVDGSGHLTLEAGVGRFPVVSAIASGLLARTYVDDDRECAMKHIGLIAAVAMVTPYGSGDLLTRLEGQLAATTEALQSLTVSGLGLRYCSWAGGEHVNLHLNAFALFLLRKATLLGVEFQPALLDLRELWTEALVDGLESQVREALEQGQIWSDMYTLALCRLALGSGWEPSDPALGAALSMQVLLDDIELLGVFGTAAVAMALVLPDDPSLDVEGFRAHELPERVTAILNLFVSQLRVTARTAYVAVAPSAAEAAGSSDNALVLSVFAAALRAGLDEDDAASVDKLANWVALGGDVGTDSVYAGLALAEYDAAVGNSDADVQLAVSMGGTPLLQQHLITHAPMPPPFSVSWEALPRPLGPLLFITSGRGEASVAVSLRFVPAALMSAPVDRGLSVRKVIRRFDGRLGAAVGPPLVAVPLGQVVTVTVQLTLDDDQTNLLVEDWLPAGLEAIDPLANALDATSAGGGVGGAQQATGCIWWWRCVFFSRETRKDRVSFYARYAYAGTHTLSYEAIAATRGTFALPPTRASATLQPEVMGLSAGGYLDVHHSSDPEVPLPDDPELQPPPPPPPSPIVFAGGNDTVVALAGSEVEVYFTITGADRTPHFTYVLAPDTTAISSSAMELKALSNELVVFRMRAPADVQEPTCVPVFLAVSVDGVTYSSFSFSVWVLPPGTTRSSAQQAHQMHSDGASPKDAQCPSFFQFLPADDPNTGSPDDGLSTAAIVSIVIGSLIAAAGLIFIVWRTRCSNQVWRIMGGKIEIKQERTSNEKKRAGTGTNTPKTPRGASTPKTPKTMLDV